jgi:hypothetical protein
MKKLILFSFAAIVAITGKSAVGGPDAFGYTYIDSNEPGGPTYSWIEIATPLGGSGTLRTALACDDCHEASIPLGFNFPYYGTSFSNITLGSNGVTYFENVYLGLGNSCMPGTPSYTMTQYNFIAHLWDDLAPNYQGGIYTQAFTDYFVIEFYDVVPCCSAGDGDTWQLILFSNGNILMQYKELSAQGLQNDLTVGIQNNPTTGLQYVCNGAGNALASGRAILWLAPGNSCTGTTVDLGAGPYCVGDVLNAPVNAINNSWSDLSTGTTFNITVAGSIGLTSLFNTGCSASTTASASASPTVSASATDLTPCEGESITLSGSGTDTYTWDNSVTDGVAFAATTGSTIYTVTGTETASGCSSTATVTIDAIAGPPTVANSTDLTPCEGESIILSGSGADTYVWDNSVTDGVGFNASTGSTVYTVTGTSTATGCSTDATITIDAVAGPATVANSSDLTPCQGENITLSGSGADTYVWDNGVNDGAAFTPPSGTTIYTVTGTETATGCSSDATISITPDALPVVNYTEGTTTVCDYFTPISLTEGTPAGGTFSGTGVTGNTFDPSQTAGTYDVTYSYTDGNNCSGFDVVTFTVSTCLGLASENETAFTIYPNPTTGVVNVNGLIAGDKIQVYTADGKLLFSTEAINSTLTFDLNAFANGTYVIFVNETASQIQKK